MNWKDGALPTYIAVQGYTLHGLMLTSKLGAFGGCSYSRAGATNALVEIVNSAK